MRVLAIGDIHGCSQALVALADAAQIMPDDLIVALGDYVDRGSNSAAVLDWLIARSKSSAIVALRGNHEIMMIRAKDDPSQINDWLANGGEATLASYSQSGDVGKLVDVPDEH